MYCSIEICRLDAGFMTFTVANRARHAAISFWKSGPWNILPTKRPPGASVSARQLERALEQRLAARLVHVADAGGVGRHVATSRRRSDRRAEQIGWGHGEDVADQEPRARHARDRDPVDADHRAAVADPGPGVLQPRARRAAQVAHAIAGAEQPRSRWSISSSLKTARARKPWRPWPDRGSDRGGRCDRRAWMRPLAMVVLGKTNAGRRLKATTGGE
jgi:hypothetical protein